MKDLGRARLCQFTLDFAHRLFGCDLGGEIKQLSHLVVFTPCQRPVSRSRTIAPFFLAQFQTCWRTSGWDTSQSTASERMMSNGSPLRKWRNGGIWADACSAGGNLPGGVAVWKVSG